MSEMPSDLGRAVHYSVIEPGTPVYDSDERRVGVLHEVLDNYREHILDAIVIEDEGGELRFIDGPEVSRTFEQAVILSITAAEVAEHGPPEYGRSALKAKVRSGLGRLFGGGRD